MSQRPGSPMGSDFGAIFRGPFGGGMRRMPRPPINRVPIFRPGRPRPPIYSPSGPNKGGTQAPIPRFPSRGSGASNFYRNPSYSYGVPTGLGALLSGQQSPFGRMVDPATGFPQRSFPRPVMGRPDFGQIGRSTSSGKSGSKGGARTVNPESQAVVDEYNRNPDPTLGESLPPPTYGTVTGLPSGLTPEQARLRQEELASRTGGGFSRLAPSDVQVSDVFMDAVESAPLLGNNPPPSPIIPDVRQQIEREIQMERAGVRPNVRPTMNVGKATGGPVGIHSGIASLVGRR